MARSKVFSTLLVVFVLFVIPSSPSSSPVASTEFYFPHVVFGDDAETTLIISNSSAQDTEVQFTAYGDNGNLIAGGSNPVTITLNAQSQARFKADELFQIPNQNTGWVKAESVNPQLSAWMLISLDSIEGDKLDGLAVSDQVSKSIVFSAVFQGPDIVTGIGLANPDAQAAHVKASLYSEGRLAEVREVQIPAYGHRAWLLNQTITGWPRKGPLDFKNSVSPINGLLSRCRRLKKHRNWCFRCLLWAKVFGRASLLPILTSSIWT